MPPPTPRHAQPQRSHLVLLLAAALLALLLPACWASVAGAKSERVYRQGEQFPLGSEAMALPRIVVFSIYMGTMRYQVR